MERIPAKEALLRQLHADGVSVIFGNPGSVEESFLAAVRAFGKIEYVMGLQEASVAAMADGYARVARKPAIVQLHSAVGLGNAVGVLYEANRSHTPMVMFAGETYSDLQAFDGFLAGDLAEMVRPVTKWSARVTHASQLLRLLRRAYKLAATAPQGPVFLSLPMDVLDDLVDADIVPTSPVDTGAACSAEAAEAIARHLVAAKAPLLLIGDGVGLSGAVAEVRALADLLACPTYGVDFAELNAAFTDPMFMGLLGHGFGDGNVAITTAADAVLAVGTPLFPELFPSRHPYFQPGAAVMQIDQDPWEIGKNFPVAVGVRADPKPSLALVIAAAQRLLPADRSAIEVRRTAVLARKAAQRDSTRKRYETVPDLPDCLSPATMMRTLAAAVPENALVYDESITSTEHLQFYLQPSRPGSYVLGRGGCIGVGWPGAVGAAFVVGDRPVIAPSGDGSAIFATQALWTAAHYRRRVIFVVCDNRAYRILKVNIIRYWKDTGQPAEPFPFMDLTDPAMDFVRIAEGFGVPATAVGTAEALTAALAAALRRAGPSLINVRVNGTVEAEVAALAPQPAASR